MAQVDWPPVDPASIAPLSDKGVPDLYNYLPSRLVSLEEAKARGWSAFYDTSACRYGHQAPRYVSNPRLCVDCHRIKAGKSTIGAKAAGAEYKRPYKQREATPAAPAVVVAQGPLEPDAREKRFLEAYAAHRNIDEAAKVVGETHAKISARMAYSKVFAEAVNSLEDRLNINRTPAAPVVFEWTPAKRKRLIQVYIDTGDMATARETIVVTPSEYYDELERNLDFADAVRGAEPLAAKALEEKAIQLALAGNDKLLQKTLSAKLPEYRERLDLNVRNPEKLSDTQLDNRLAKLLERFNSRIIDAEYRVVESERQVTALEHFGSDGEGRGPEPNQDLL